MPRTLAAAIAVYALPVSLIVLAVPLILKRVPPNDFYGFRMRPAFDSTAQWYRANSIGGWYQYGAGVLMLAGNLVVAEHWKDSLLVWLITGDLLVLTAAIVAATVHVRRGQ